MCSYVCIWMSSLVYLLHLIVDARLQLTIFARTIDKLVHLFHFCTGCAKSFRPSLARCDFLNFWSTDILKSCE